MSLYGLGLVGAKLTVKVFARSGKRSTKMGTSGQKTSASAVAYWRCPKKKLISIGLRRHHVNYTTLAQPTQLAQATNRRQRRPRAASKRILTAAIFSPSTSRSWYFIIQRVARGPPSPCAWPIRRPPESLVLVRLRRWSALTG